MAISAIAPTKKEPVQAVQLRTAAPETDARQEELQAETKKPAEVMLFASKTQYVTEAPKMTATHRPTFESVGAAVVSTHTSPALFTTNSEGRFVVASGFSHAAGGVTELASALAGAESNAGSGDKKDGEHNTFLSAQKSLAELRKEALDDDIMGIMALC
ncbi:MAG: hypothetical protein K6A44_05220 [bacterium]|nr:hypothetical protein [bacterium]